MGASWDIKQAKEFLEKTDMDGHTSSVRHFLGGAIEAVQKLRDETVESHLMISSRDRLIEAFEKELKVIKENYAHAGALVNKRNDTIKELKEAQSKLICLAKVQRIKELEAELAEVRKQIVNRRTCDFIGCTKEATCGTPLKNGYFISSCNEHRPY